MQQHPVIVTRELDSQVSQRHGLGKRSAHVHPLVFLGHWDDSVLKVNDDGAEKRETSHGRIQHVHVEIVVERQVDTLECIGVALRKHVECSSTKKPVNKKRQKQYLVRFSSEVTNKSMEHASGKSAAAGPSVCHTLQDFPRVPIEEPVLKGASSWCKYRGRQKLCLRVRRLKMARKCLLVLDKDGQSLKSRKVKTRPKRSSMMCWM